jgi:hypothetical protein
MLYSASDCVFHSASYMGILRSTHTYDHRTLKTRLPVRSALFKQRTGGLVVRWVTTSEYPLLDVFAFFCLLAGWLGRVFEDAERTRGEEGKLAQQVYWPDCRKGRAETNVIYPPDHHNNTTWVLFYCTLHRAAKNPYNGASTPTVLEFSFLHQLSAQQQMEHTFDGRVSRHDLYYCCIPDNIPSYRYTTRVDTVPSSRRMVHHPPNH